MRTAHANCYKAPIYTVYFLLAGWLIGKIKRDVVSHADILSVLLVNILLPCKVFSTFANNFSFSFFVDYYIVLLAALILLSVLVIVSHFISRLLTQNKYEQKIYNYSFIITNYAYLGYALIDSVLGESILAQFMLFAIPFIVYTYTVGYTQLTGRSKNKALINPITVAIMLGILVGLLKISLPEVVVSVTSMASSCVGPLSMLLTGITLSSFPLKDMIADKTAFIFSALRLVGIPALVYLVCCSLRIESLLPMVLTITCMPCGLNTIIFPKLVGADCKAGARLALITHAFSAITVPFWFSLMQ